MNRYSLRHLSDHRLLHDLAAMVDRERESTADVLAHIAEVSTRKLHLKAGYPSMKAYCIKNLHLSEGAAAKRVHAAHAARRFPIVFEMVADGRLHLSAVVLLARHLRPENLNDLLAAAIHRSKAEVESMLAAKYPRTDVLGLVTQIVSRREAPGTLALPTALDSQGASIADVENPESARPSQTHVDAASKVSPLSTQSYAVQFTMNSRAHALLQYARSLLGHEIPSGDIAQVIEKALELAVPQLEKTKFGATSRPRPVRAQRSSNPRYIPRAVRREVWARDGGQCTFVSEDGHRCEARWPLEYDHVVEVARGGQATVEKLRLRCRAHNQLTAEQAFGVEFMRQKRESAIAKRAQDDVVVRSLRSLGFSATEARRAVELCAEMSEEASLEQRVRMALSYFRMRGTKQASAAS